MDTVRISNITRSGNDVLIQIPSASGFTHRLETTPSFQLPSWTDSGRAQPGNGGVLTFTDPGAVTNEVAGRVAFCTIDIAHDNNRRIAA